jgi:hypothetical protein
MTRAHPKTLLLGLALAFFCMTTARSEPLRLALVIANGQYASLPALARCTASAATVRDALRARGFEVVERSNLGRGEFDTAIGAFARRLAASPGASAALYFCGYALEFNGRSFLLPASAAIARDYDVLTQGVISKSLVDSLLRARDSTGFILLDAFRTPNAVPSTGLARLVDQISPSTFAVIGASNDGPAEGPTAASLALRDQLAEVEPGLDSFVTGMRRRLSKAAAVTAYVVAAVARPAREEAPAPAAPAPDAVPPAPVAAQPPPPPPRQIVADEDRMSEQDRRDVQMKLAAMGYYSGRIDATFGPETRAAIRRYQFEIKAELTGRLTAEQATRLVNSVR